MKPYLKSVFSCAFALTAVQFLRANPPGGELVENASMLNPAAVFPISPSGVSNDGLFGPGRRGAPVDIYLALSPNGALPSLPWTDTVISIRPRFNPLDPAFPYNDDWLLPNPNGSIHRRDSPSIVIWIHFLFNQIPYQPNYMTGGHYHFGFRIIGIDQWNREYWCGVFVGRENGVPYFSYRGATGNNPIKPISDVSEEGWMTLGLSWGAHGYMEVYAAPGRVMLTAADRIAIDYGYYAPTPGYLFPELLTSLSAVFLSFAQPDLPDVLPDWKIGAIMTFWKPLPKIKISKGEVDGTLDLMLEDLRVGVEYEVLSSTDLSIDPVTWGVERSFTATATTQTFTVAVGTDTKRFYVARWKY